MKVKELIALLQAQDAEAEVALDVDGHITQEDGILEIQVDRERPGEVIITG